MSIYATSLDFCGESEGDDPAPIRYRESHILPTPGDERCGSLDLGLIPGYITQDGWCVLGVDHTASGHDSCRCEPLTDLPPLWPYLRVAIDTHVDLRGVVVLDYSQVEKLRDHLTEWLRRAVTS